MKVFSEKVPLGGFVRILISIIDRPDLTPSRRNGHLAVVHDGKARGLDNLTFGNLKGGHLVVIGLFCLLRCRQARPEGTQEYNISVYHRLSFLIGPIVQRSSTGR